MTDFRPLQQHHFDDEPREFAQDEGGLRPPPGLSEWRRLWWWFDFLILVKLARLRFIGILLVIGIIITQWDTLIAYYRKWTRPSGDVAAVQGDIEYFCPMHPSVVRDNPKEKCPICFMPLSKRKKGETSEEALPDGVVNRVQLSPYRVVLAGVQTWKVEHIPLTKEINAVGTVEFNERGQKTVSARMAGRIDELLASETGQMVKAGDVLASIYSPDLIVTMQNLLQAKKSGNNSLLDDARRKLELLGISKDQIDEIVQSGKANTHLRIRSPISGHVIRKYVREGQYTEEGMALYDVVDLSTVWIQAQVYEDDIPFLPTEQIHGGELEAGPEVVATTRAFPNEEFRGRLRFIYPHVDEQTRTLTVRFELPNPGHKLRPGSTANVRLRVSPKDVSAISAAIATQGDEEQSLLAEGRVLAVPDGAVIDTGSQKIAYRESLPGVFEGVELKLGPKMVNEEGATFYPVISGLAAGDAIVTSGSFLVDAETRLNPAAGSIYFGGSGGSKASGSTTVRATTPDDPDAKINAALSKLSLADRKQAEAQGTCPILEGSRLGSMGVPIKLKLEGRGVFICCPGCKETAQKNPKETVAKVDALLKQPKAKRAVQSATGEVAEKKERTIADALARLAPEDRKQAEQQRFCPIVEDSRLGSMGVPIKVTLEGRTVFLCCSGCKAKATKDPAGTLQKVDKLLKQSTAQKSTEASSDNKPLSKEEQELAAELQKLSQEDRILAEKQRFCAVSEESRLGSMGMPVKLMIDGETVFLCCEGCETAAKEDAAATVKRVRELRAEKRVP